MMAILLSLAATLTAPPANTLDSEAVIADLITKQRELAAIYDTLSYTATLESTVQEDFQEAPLRTTLVYTVSHRRGTTLVNCVSSLSIKEIEQRENGELVDSKYEVEHTPTEQRLLLGDRVQVYWPNTKDVGVRSVQRPRSGGGGFPRNMAAYMSDSSLRAQCFGANSPFFERYAQRPAFVRWEARTVSGSTDIQVLRTIEVGPGKEKQDLIYQLESVHGLLRSAQFRPGGSTSDTETRYDVWEYKGRLIPVPVTISTETLEGDGAFLSRRHVTFSNFHDESEQPAHTQESAGAMGSTLQVSAPVS